MKYNFTITDVFESFELNSVKEKDYQYEVKKGFILLLDACGFSNLSDSKLKESIANIINSKAILEEEKKFSEIILKSKQNIHFNFDTFFFQDSLIIAIEIIDNKFAIENVNIIFQVFSMYFNDSLFNGIFWRGALTFGEYYRTENGFWGKAFNEIAKIYESPRFFGILCTESIVNLYNQSINPIIPWISEEEIFIKDKNNNTQKGKNYILQWYLSLIFISPPPELSNNYKFNNEIYGNIINLKRTDVTSKNELYENTLSIIDNKLIGSEFNIKRNIKDLIKLQNHVFIDLKENDIEKFKILLAERIFSSPDFILTDRPLNVKDYCNMLIFNNILSNGFIYSSFDSSNNDLKRKESDNLKFIKKIEEETKVEKFMSIVSTNRKFVVIDNIVELGEIIEIVLPYQQQNYEDDIYYILQDNYKIIRIIKSYYKNGNSMNNIEIALEILNKISNDIDIKPLPILHDQFWL